MNNNIIFFFIAYLFSVTFGEEINAICRFADAVHTGATGSITFVQPTQEDGTTISYADMDAGDMAEGIHIHEYAVTDNCGADFAGGHYNPDCNGPCLDGVGELSPKWGNLNNALTPQTYTDSEVKLSGEHSVLGRSIVVHSSADGAPRIACCNIVIQSGKYGIQPDYDEEVQNAEATCTFPTAGSIHFKTGQVTTGDARPGSFIHSDIAEANAGNMWGIYDKLDACEADGAKVFRPVNGLNFHNMNGDFYGVGDLSNKFGHAQGNTTYRDASIDLHGNFSIVNKTVMLSTSEGAVECCDVMTEDTFPELPEQEIMHKEAFCTFTEAATGTVWIRESENTKTGAWIWSDGITFTGEDNIAANLSLHIHLSGDLQQDACGDAGPHYGTVDTTVNSWTNWDFVGPTSEGTMFSTKYENIEIGDLSGKHGQIGHATKFGWWDAQVILTGQFSVAGRSMVIHDSTGDKWACCNIGVKNPAVVDSKASDSDTTKSTSASPSGIDSTSASEASASATETTDGSTSSTLALSALALVAVIMF